MSTQPSPYPPHRPDEEPVLGDIGTDHHVTEHLLSPVGRFPRRFWMLFFPLLAGTGWLFFCIAYTFRQGIGVWGNNIPVAWAFAITNFVWWIGIGHAGTFISAILLLLEQRWRTSINRFSEAMTLFAVIQAGMFPVLHLGRPWFAYWLAPYPATMNVWPNFKSALTWDMAAVSTYFTISLLFWFLGLLPDLAAARDMSSGFKRKMFGIFALGWRGAARHWNHYKVAYGLLAGLATPLVISVHSIVSLDFSIAQLPGWHSTLFPPYFVAGAIYSGFAMVLSVLIPSRKLFGLEQVVTKRHLDNMSKMLLVTGWVVIYAYVIEQFLAWYSGDEYEFMEFFRSRPIGTYETLFFLMIFCNCVVPQSLWFKSVRQGPVPLFIVSILINVGMWLERFIIIVTSLYQNHMPSSWAVYSPTWVDISILVGSVCFFLLLFLTLMRLIPIIPITETKEMRHEMVEERAAPRHAA